MPTIRSIRNVFIEFSSTSNASNIFPSWFNFKAIGFTEYVWLSVFPSFIYSIVLISSKESSDYNNKIIQLEKKFESLTKEIQHIKKIINNNKYNKTDSDDNYNDIIYYN